LIATTGPKPGHLTTTTWGADETPEREADQRALARRRIHFYPPANVFHGKDERMGVKSFYDGLEYLYRLVNRLSLANSASPR